MRLLAVLALMIGPLAACGGSENAGSTGSGGATELKVTVWPAGPSGPSKSATVTCPGDEACDQLAKLPLSAFDPVPGDVACTQIYGGPDQAHVEGTLRGEPVDARFKLTDGCESARWSRVAFLLGRAS
jgi:hypothetical protein